MRVTIPRQLSDYQSGVILVVIASRYARNRPNLCDGRDNNRPLSLFFLIYARNSTIETRGETLPQARNTL